jgi:hypothetical protein
VPQISRHQEEMEDALPHTEKRFRQHQETPLLAKRRSKLGLDCTSDDAQALLNGSYDRELEDLTDEPVVGFSS